MVADVVDVSGTVTVALETPACLPCYGASCEIRCFPEVSFGSASALLWLWEDKNEKQFEVKILGKSWMITVY